MVNDYLPGREERNRVSAKTYLVTAYTISSNINPYTEAYNYSTKNSVRVGYPMRKKRDKQHEIYMAHTRILRCGHNTTYIPLTCVRGSRWGNTYFRFGVGGKGRHQNSPLKAAEGP